MGNHLSSFWKKRGQHNTLDYVDDRTVIWGHDNTLPSVEKTFLYEGHITPNRVIQNGNLFRITYLHPMFIIYGLMVITEKGANAEHDLVKSITLFGHHPNRDPDTHLYCLPDHKKGVPFDTKYFEILLTNIKTYYLDDCFFSMLKYMECKKIKSISIKLNQGE